MVTSVPLTFELVQERVKVMFPVANEVQKQWLELKMIPEMITYFKSITGIKELSILPFVSEAEEKVSRTYYPSPPRPSLPAETICLQNLVSDLDLEEWPKAHYVSYATTTYRCAWLKAHYPNEYKEAYSCYF